MTSDHAKRDVKIDRPIGKRLRAHHSANRRPTGYLGNMTIDVMNGTLITRVHGISLIQVRVYSIGMLLTKCIGARLNVDVRLYEYEYLAHFATIHSRRRHR